VGGDDFGNSEVRAFLPFRPVDPDSSVPGLPGTTYRQLIPAERIGLLYEDMTCYTYPGVTGLDLQGTFVEIAEVDGCVEVVGKVPRSWVELGPNSLIVGEIGGGEITSSLVAEEEEEEEQPLKVPWKDFFMAMHALRLQKELAPPFTGELTVESLNTGRRFLGELNGQMPYCWSFVDRFAEWLEMHRRMSPEAEERFKDLVRGVFEKLVSGAGQGGSTDGAPRVARGGA
jgi:hypothetical protein